MNERIQQLAKQAQKDYEGYQDKGLYYEIFAELIVKECADLFPLTFTDEQYQRRIDKTILKHFGVIE